MTTFSLQIGDWFEGCPPAELAATNALLTIKIQNHIVSSVVNKKSRCTSEALCLPLYPLAEWLAANWWTLLYESNAYREPQEFRMRHNLMFAGEGYLLPDLLFLPEQDTIRLQWQPRSFNHDTLALYSQGSVSVPLNDVKRGLADFISHVIERLHVCDIFNTPLQNDWQAICASMKDPEERDFCIACAQLGLDPYCIGDHDAELILQADETLASHIDMTDLFSAVSIDNLDSVNHWLQEQAVCNRSSSMRTTAALQDILLKLPSATQQVPWLQGYEDARWLHANFLQHAGDLQNLLQTMSDMTVTANIPHNFCTALVHSHSSPFFLTATPPKSFLQGRMLGEFLRYSNHQLNLVTHTSTAPQKYSRAFAAELLAPAEKLKLALKGKTYLCDDELSDLSEQFHTSEFVIRHQLVNHQLALIDS